MAGIYKFTHIHDGRCKNGNRGLTKALQLLKLLKKQGITKIKWYTITDLAGVIEVIEF